MLRSGSHSPKRKYTGVYKRRWGKWLTQIKKPREQKQIWVGTFDTPEMAALAFDVAAFHFRGHGAKLNFPEHVESLPSLPPSSTEEEIKTAARETALRPLATAAEGGGALYENGEWDWEGGLEAIEMFQWP